MNKKQLYSRMRINNLHQISKIKVRKNIEWFFAFLLFLLIPPFFVWHTKIGGISIIIISLFTLIYCDLKKENIIVFLFVLFLYLFCIYKSSFSAFGIIIVFLSCLIFLINDIFLIRCVDKFTLIYSVTLIPSIIIYLLVNVLDVSVTYNVLEPLNELKNYVYYQYPFLIQEAKVFNVLPRFHAYYDEPGVVGVVSGTLLTMNKLNIKKIINIPILIGGILSFSLAFYIIILFMGILFLKNKYKVVFFIFLMLLITLFSNSEVMNIYIFDRLQIENGKLAGDNRTAEGFDIWYKGFKNTSSYFWGLGSEAKLQYNYGGASYKNLIISYGIIFFILYIIMFVIIGYQKLKLKKELLMAVFLFLFILYQRPFVTNYFYLFLLYCPFVYLQEHNASSNYGNKL